MSVACALVLALLAGIVCPAWGDEAGNENKPAQAIVEILVVEYNSNTLFDLGTTGVFERYPKGTPGTDPGNLSLAEAAFPTLDPSGIGLAMFLDKITLGEGTFQFLIQALEQDERFEILSNPRLIVAQGDEKPAKVQTVIEVPYETNKISGVTGVTSTEFKDAGVTLEAKLLNIYDDEYVDLWLHAAVGAIGARHPVAVAAQTNEPLPVPEFFKRSIRTEVVVADRQVLVLGALLSTEKMTTRRNVPVLGRIPLLKYLFSTYRDDEACRELIFFVKPVIHRGGYVPRPADISELDLDDKK